jgi:endogenous inhibitor of DNA gyrase (YacG/DUF329 family)
VWRAGSDALALEPVGDYIETMTDDPTASHPAPCPICGKPRVQRFRPFCSKRCADVDLNRWLSGSYAVPAEQDDERPDDEGERDARQTRH